MELSDTDRRLLDAVAEGLPLVSAPYAALAKQLGMTEAKVLDRLAWLQRAGTIKRFGIIVRHHELGYTANAMVAWNVADARVAEIGARMAALPDVSLCYQRPRRPPDWPYNLFCMLHGRERAAVEASVARLSQQLGLDHVERTVLFSRRRFKQRGARYLRVGEAVP